MGNQTMRQSILLPFCLILAGAANLARADVIFEEDFSSGVGQFSTSGRASHSSGQVLMRGGSSPGSIISGSINVSQYSNLTLRFTRSASGLDGGEAGVAAISVNGGAFNTLESVGNTSGSRTLQLPAASTVVLRFSISASSYFETYTVDNIVLEGDRSGSQPPPPPPPPPEPQPQPQPEPSPVPSPGQTYFWPLSGNLGTHDPTIMYENGRWYEFQTGPGIFRKVSNDGFRWEPLPSVLPNGLSWWRFYVPQQQGIDAWAPEVRAYNGRVWMYYSVSSFGSNNSIIGLLSASSLAADNWRDEGLVVRSRTSDNFNAIDPDLVIDANNDPWLAYGSFWSGIKLTRLNPSTMKPTGTVYSLANRSGGIEAPTVVYRNGYYYLFVSVGRCCDGVNSTYQIRYGRSRNITGPYLDKSGNDMRNGGGSLLDAGNDRWIGPGGQDISGTNVIARHAYDATDNGAPKLLISNLNWTSDNWPRY